ncbi:MAG: PGF-CTERM sorting domain-containing protein [Halobacteriaceae archaeon]
MVLAALVVCSMVAASVAFAGAVGAQADEPVAGFAQSGATHNARVGDLVSKPFTIELGSTKNATVVFSGARTTNVSDFWANVTVHDGDGDGIVKLNINTWELGHSNPFIVKDGSILNYSQTQYAEDSMIIPSSTDLDDGAYSLYLGPGTNPADVLQSYQSNARLMIDNGEIGDFDGATAPGAYPINTLRDVYKTPPDVFARLRPNVSAEMDSIVADGDKVILSPWGSGFVGPLRHAMEMENISTPEQATDWAMAKGYINFSVRQTNNPNGTPAKVLDYDKAVATGGIQVDFRHGYKKMLFVLNTTIPMFQRGGSGEYVDMGIGERYMSTFQKKGRADPAPDYSRMITDNFTVVQRNLEPNSPVATLEDSELGGVTTLAPGTKLDIYVKEAGTDNTWKFDANVEVRPGIRDAHPPKDGVFETHPFNFSVDLGDVDATKVRIAVWAKGYGRIGTYPPGLDKMDIEPDKTVAPPDPSPTTTDTGDGAGTATTTEGGQGTSAGTTAPGTSGPSDTTTSGGGGGGGGIPGFTATVALVAIVAAALIALRRE